MLNIDNLTIDFATQRGLVSAVRSVSFDIGPNEIFTIVGESGSGKSATAGAVADLLPRSARIGGSVRFEGKDILQLSPKQRRLLAGESIGYISQDALAALNPCTTVGFQIAETLMVRRGTSRSAAYARAVELLDAVGIRNPEKTVHLYPHQLSGGMRQRALIAISLALEPSLLIADEPTTALDVTVTVQILKLLQDLQARFHMSILLITHDMGVVHRMGGRVAVMNAGEIIETGPVESIFSSPTHPITKTLLDAVPTIDLSRFEEA